MKNILNFFYMCSFKIHFYASYYSWFTGAYFIHSSRFSLKKHCKEIFHSELIEDFFLKAVTKPS